MEGSGKHGVLSQSPERAGKVWKGKPHCRPKSAWYQEEVCLPCSGNDADLNLDFRDLVTEN